MRAEKLASASATALPALSPRSIKTHPSHRGYLLAAVGDALSVLSDASCGEYPAFLKTVERVFVSATDAARASVIIYSAGAWRRSGDNPWAGDDRAVIDLSSDVLHCRSPKPLANTGLFVPIRQGALAVLLTAPRPGKETENIAASLAIATELALTALECKRVTCNDGDELDVMQRVALRILKSLDLQEIFLLITHETRRLLDADICGIMLRDGENVVMQRCVGNFSSATASLRMSAGQGVAGRVVATKQPCYVEDYVGSSLISNDFVKLARDEKVRSALAAPLMSHDDVIGVLEVWRRQSGPFEEQHTQRLVTLANLTSIAIENARLAQARQSVVEQLAATNLKLTERFEVIRTSAAFQNELIRLQLEGKSLAHVAAKAGAHLGGAAVIIVDANLAIEGASPQCDGLTDDLRQTMQSALKLHKSAPSQAVALPFQDRTLLLHSASAGAENLGFVVILCDVTDEGIELALSQICTATALHLIERRAAGRARAETLTAVLWDLLDGSDEVRRFALARANDMRVELDGRQRVYLCKLGSVEQHAANEGWSVNDLSASRRRIAQAYRDVEGLTPCVRLAGVRGNSVALICGGSAARDADGFGIALARAIAAIVPGLSVRVGVSSPSDSPAGLAAAYREALISLEVAQQRGNVSAATYEDAGIVGLLLSLREEADVRKLVRMIFGSLLDQKPDDLARLLGTLTAFFELNCSRTATARQLGVHEKTVAYRLAKIRELSGLDFTKHEKRLLADIALRMHGMTTHDGACGRLLPAGG